MQKETFFGTVVGLILATASTAGPSIATFSDDTFENDDWTRNAQILMGAGPITQTAEQVADNGNPGAHRRMTHEWGGGIQAIIFHLSINSTYLPAAQGAIQHIDYAEDHRSNVIGSVGWGLVLEQDGVFWRSTGGGGFDGDNWTTSELLDLTPFRFRNHQDVLGCPDFSANASDMVFGYYRSNTTHSFTVIRHNIDNWSVEVVTGTSVIKTANVLSSSAAICHLAAPGSVELDVLQNNGAILLFDEQIGVSDDSIEVDIVEPGTYSAFAAGKLALPSTPINSHFLHFDPHGQTAVEITGNVVFRFPILGLVVNDATLDATDTSLGQPGTMYPTGLAERDLEGSCNDPTCDTLVLSAYSLELDLGAQTAVDQIRILTAACLDTVDSDADGVVDLDDNCLMLPNADQHDSNSDGFGNACDADIGGPDGAGFDDGQVNFIDLGVLKDAFFSTPGSPSWNPDADFTADDQVNFLDLGRMKNLFFRPPGLSCVANGPLF